MKKQGELNTKIATFVLASTIIQTAALGADITGNKMPNAIYYGDKTIQIKSQRIIDALGSTSKVRVLSEAQSMPARYTGINSSSSNVARYIDKSVTGNMTKKVITVDAARKENPVSPIKPVLIGPIYVDQRPDPIIAKYAGPIPPTTPEVGVVEPTPLLRYAGPIQPVIIEDKPIPIISRYAGPIQLQQKMF